jgi:hypothetical protein
MLKTMKFKFKKPITVVDDEDEATLAAIDEGVRDAKAGWTVHAKNIRKLLRMRIADSSARKKPTGRGLTPEQVLATLPEARKLVFESYYGKHSKPLKACTRRQRKK